MLKVGKNHGLTRVRAVGIALLTFVCCSALSGCLVAGYGSNSADTILPVGLGVVFVLGLLLWVLLRKC